MGRIKKLLFVTVLLTVLAVVARKLSEWTEPPIESGTS
jgi:hypothetical protein